MAVDTANHMMAFPVILILLCLLPYSSQYQKAAVATDVPICSDMAKSILERGGSAVDASITAVLCVGTVNPQSSNLGGGFSMVTYMDKKPDALISLEKAPLASDLYMKDGKHAHGGKVIAVPGQVIGLWEAHQRYGKLPWKSLFEPVIDIARNGHPVTKHLERILVHYMKKNPVVLDVFRKEDGSLPKTGDTKKALTYANTLEKIANNGPWEFYMGETGKALIKEIQEWGGIITEEDFCPCNIAPAWKTPLSTNLTNGNLTMFSTPLSGSGSLLLYIMNILDEFNITKESVATYEDRVLLYHRFLEASKFAMDVRNLLGADTESPEVKQILAALESKQFAKLSAQQIRDDRAIPYPDDYRKVRYRNYGNQQQNGDTSHISVLAENGDAVSVTTSIGYYFGCGYYSNSTGIFMNNHVKTFNKIPSHPDSLKPGRRIFSSTSPAIILDSNQNVKMVIGSAGTLLIIPTNAWVILRTLWTGATLKEAIDEKRIYAFAASIYVEMTEAATDVDGVIGQIRHSLDAMGHFTEDRQSISVPQAIIKYTEGDIEAYSDFIRKGGIASGY